MTIVARSARRLTVAVIVLCISAFVIFTLMPRTEAENGSPLAPALVATKTVTQNGDLNGNGFVNPGDGLRYLVTINNNGVNPLTDTATGVVINDTIDANTTLVGGSVIASAVAVNDNYTSIGNVGITVPDGPSDLLANDLDANNIAIPVLNITQVNGAPFTFGVPVNTANGQATVNANGSFSFNPTPGFEGNATFAYTLSNGTTLTDTATVTINVAGMIWFVNANAGTNGDGRLASPFNSLANFVAGAADDAGDNIFLYESATAYSGGITLLANQKLIGQDSTTPLATIAGVTAGSFSNTLPAMNSGNGVFSNLTNAAGSGVTLSTGNTLNGFRVGDTTVADITDGGGTVGALTIANVVTTGTGAAVDIDQGGALNVSFDSLSSTSSTAQGVHLAATGAALTGAFAAPAGSIAGSTTAAFQVGDGVGGASTGGTVTITYGGTLGATGAARCVDIQDRPAAAGNITFSGTLTHTGNGTAILMDDNASGIILFSASTSSLSSGSSTAVNLTDNTGATINFTLGSLAIDSTTATAFNVTNGGTVNVTGTGNTINATSGPANTNSAPALNFVNATIGASNITFRSIASGNATAAADPANGIVLNATGTSGGLIVAGLGSVVLGGDNSGGTIRNTTGDAVSLVNTRAPSFNNMNIQQALGHGINGTAVNIFSFTNGKINDVGDAVDESCVSFDDLDAANVTGTFTFTNNQCTLAESNGVDIENYGATLTNVNISNNTFSDPPDVLTPGSAVLLISNSTAATNGVVTAASLNNNSIIDFRAGAGFVLQANSALGATTTVTYGTANGANLITVSGNLFNGGNGGIGNQPDRFVTGAINGRGTAGYVVANNGTAGNPIQKIDGVGIELSNFGPGSMSANVSGNHMAVNNAVASSGIGIGCTADSDATTTDNGTLTLIVENNNVSQTDGQGIFALARESTCTLNARITNNTVAAPFTTSVARSGIQASSGSAAGDTTACFDIRTNTTAGSTNIGTGSTAPGISIRKQGVVATVNDFGIEGLAPSPATAAQAEAFVSGLNPGSSAGTFGTGGTASLLGANYVSCNTAPIVGEAGAFEPDGPKSVTRDQEDEFESLVAASRGYAPRYQTEGQEMLPIMKPAIPEDPDAGPGSVPVFSIPGEPETAARPDRELSFSSNPLSLKSLVDLSALEKRIAARGVRTDELRSSVEPDLRNADSEPGRASKIITRLARLIVPTAYAQKADRLAPESGENVNMALGSLPPGENIRVQFDVTVDANIPTNDFSVSNTAQITSTNHATINSTTATTTVVHPPTLSKAFGAASILLNATTTLTFTIGDANPATGFTNVAFSDTLPAGMVIATPNGLVNNCGGGTITAVQNTDVFSISALSRAANSTCTIVINVTGTSGGVKNNLTGAVSSTEGGTGLTAGATVTVLAPTAANANVSGRVVDAGGRGVSGAQVMMQNQNGMAIWASTNPFGYYRFTGVPAGQTYIVSPRHKRFTFDARTVTVNDDLADFDFVAQPVN